MDKGNDNRGYLLDDASETHYCTDRLPCLANASLGIAKQRLGDTCVDHAVQV